MPRQVRRLVRDSFYHILSRGNNRQMLFRDREDFQFYLSTVSRYAQKFSISIFHYCLMTNHVHMILRSSTSDDGITRFMHGIQTVYAIRCKNKYELTGHIFENRFKNYHVESEAYLLECGRYIERNPVRAKMVEHPGDYEWSSFSHYGQGKHNHLITTNPVYETLSSTAYERQTIYQRYVMTERAYEKIIDQFFDERILVQARPSEDRP